MEEIEVWSKMASRELEYKVLDSCGVLVWCFWKHLLIYLFLFRRNIIIIIINNKWLQLALLQGRIYHRKKESWSLGTQAEQQKKWVHGKRHKVRDSPYVHGPNFHLISSKGYQTLGFVIDLPKQGSQKMENNILISLFERIYMLYFSWHTSL